MTIPFLFCRYVYQYIQLLERNIKVETLEGINEKIRKRLKNPKLSNSNCARVYRHVSAAWCRSLVIGMALITPLHPRPTEIRGANLLGGMESDQLLCVDLQTEELWSSAFEDTNHLKTLETKWNPPLSKIKNVIVKRVSDEDLETASTLLRSSYNFYKDTSCALLPSGINLYMVPAQLATETYVQPGIDGLDILDMNTSRKLLLWAYSLLHCHCINVSHVIKYCEENAKVQFSPPVLSLLTNRFSYNYAKTKYIQQLLELQVVYSTTLVNFILPSRNCLISVLIHDSFVLSL